jgi:hypothetical protein
VTRAPAGRRAGEGSTPTGSGAETELASDEGLSVEEVEVLLRVGIMLRRLRFGTVLLVVQDGKVVQIETAEKFRL